MVCGVTTAWTSAHQGAQSNAQRPGRGPTRSGARIRTMPHRDASRRGHASHRSHSTHDTRAQRAAGSTTSSHQRGHAAPHARGRTAPDVRECTRHKNKANDRKVIPSFSIIFMMPMKEGSESTKARAPAPGADTARRSAQTTERGAARSLSPRAHVPALHFRPTVQPNT